MKNITSIALIAAAATLFGCAATSEKAPAKAADTKNADAKATAARPEPMPQAKVAAKPAADAAPTWVADRSATVPARPEAIKFATLQFTPPKAKDFRRTLPDGTPVYMAPSKEFPLVNLTLTFKGGAYMDPK
ncbi:MAG: hypothetical protein EBU31_14175, partial [Proteobacteria bacterium]|nr:hypothetical protein [Pseudomonadota bacterium]